MTSNYPWPRRLVWGRGGEGLRILRGSHSFQRERRGNKSSPTEDKAEYKGGHKVDCQLQIRGDHKNVTEPYGEDQVNQPPLPLR